MLAWYYGPVTVAVSVPVSVCQSVTSRHCIKTAERIRLIFGSGASLDFALRCRVIRVGLSARQQE